MEQLKEGEAVCRGEKGRQDEGQSEVHQDEQERNLKIL